MIDRPLFITVMMLLTLSLVMSYSLSTYTIVQKGSSEFHFFIRQGFAIGLGVVTIWVLSQLNPDNWFIPISMILFFTFLVLMILMPLLPESLVKETLGARRWIRLGPLSLAPIEFFKVGFVAFLAWSFSRKFAKTTKMKYKEEFRRFAPYLGLYGLVVILVAIFQKDLGQVVVLGGTLVILFLFVGGSKRFFFSLVSLAFVAFVALIFAAPHRIARIKSWWISIQDTILSIFPIETLQSLRIEAGREPYQISNSLNSIYNGGYFGQGLGNGQFKLGYLSEVHTDFILAGIAEEVGLMGLMFVVSTMLFIIYRIFKIASRIKNPAYSLFSIGIGLLIALSFILNSYGISGLTPIKGIAVPFLSYGGSHIWASCFSIGMILMVSKKIPRNAKGQII